MARSVTYHLRRLGRVIRGLVVLLHCGRGHILYISVDSGWGIMYNLLLIVVGWLSNYVIFLHHHSFSYIDCVSQLMQLLVVISGKNARHIFPCDGMLDKYKFTYPFDGDTLICSNALFAPSPRPRLRFASNDPFRVGLLSNRFVGFWRARQ